MAPHSRRTILRATGVLSLGIALPAWGAPDYWDPRLNQVCGLYLDDKASSVPAGQGYWRLTRGEFQNEQESGGTHHIFYKCLDLNGNPIENQKVWTSWSYTHETNFVWQLTKGPLDSYWGNFPMYVGACAGTALCGPASPGPWPYNAYVDPASSPRGYAGPSDKVLGMGMTNPQGTPCGAHVSFRLTWRWTIKPADPVIHCFPVKLTPSRSQGFDARPDLFTISNSTGGTLSYSLSDTATWLSTTPSSGTVSGSENDAIAVSYATAGLPIGEYHATIIVSGNAGNSPQTVAVSLAIHPFAYVGDFDADLDVDQQDFAHLQLCLNAPDVPAQAGCADAVLDGDFDVDQADVSLFEACISGPGSPPPAGCIR